MYRLKMIVNIVAFFLLLIVIAATPILLTNYQNRQRLDRLNEIPIAQQIIDYDASVHMEDTLDKIRRMKKSVKVNIGEGLKTQMLSHEEEKDLIKSLEEQIMLLQDLGALPQLMLGSTYSASISKQTYVDIQSTNTVISVWSIHVAYPEVEVQAYMDTETAIIYDISMIFKENNRINDYSGISKTGYLSYLQIDPDIVDEWGERFDTLGYYTKNMISLFIVSYSGGNMTVYRFDERTDFINITEATFFGNDLFRKTTIFIDDHLEEYVIIP